MQYGLIGEKLGHSFSKIIHESIADYTYELKEIAKADLDAFMKEKDFKGINVTIPYKTDVIAYLDYIDENAEKIGAVNTVVNRDGKLYGYNTDFGGMKMLFTENGFDFKDEKVLILGTGGTSKTAKAVVKALGAKEVYNVSRSGELNYQNVKSLHSDAAYIINTTPCGMYPDNFSAPIDLTGFTELKGVGDVVYNPLKTRLCLEAEALKINSCGGLYMLICQAVLACEHFTGRYLDVKTVSDRLYKKLFSEKQNIVLTGMPGSGKSTVGRLLSKMTGRAFYDTDDLITKEHGVISEIFSAEGEEYFRKLEEEAVKKVSTLSSSVIATGGGAILKGENISALKQNGKIFFLNRPLEDIIPTDDRPLSSDKESLKKRFNERYGIYLSTCDEEIRVDATPDKIAKEILEKL